jgi:hypothetical protein
MEVVYRPPMVSALRAESRGSSSTAPTGGVRHVTAWASVTMVA